MCLNLHLSGLNKQTLCTNATVRYSALLQSAVLITYDDQNQELSLRNVHPRTLMLADQGHREDCLIKIRQLTELRH